jgi:hypothetical protein
MKKILTGLLIITGFGLSAQTLLNSDFENWNFTTTYAPDTVPNNWYAMYCNTVHQSTDALQGSFAPRIQGYFACGIAPGIMVNGHQPAGYGNIIEGGTPFTSKPAAINGSYKYTEVTEGDSAEVTIILKKFNAVTMKHDTVGIGVQSLGAAASYSAFTVNMNYLLPSLTPDSIIIMFNSSKYYLWDQVTMALPSLYIDMIKLPEPGVAGISENNPSYFQSVVYPNPFSDHSELLIKGDLSSYKNLEMTLFDTAGRKVRSTKITDNPVKLSSLSSGNYIYKICDAENVIASGKISVN